MWRSIKKHPVPGEWGIYIVARFEDGKMVDYDTKWALCEGYFGPNNLGYQENIKPTHWMPYKEYVALLENASREE